MKKNFKIPQRRFLMALVVGLFACGCNTNEVLPIAEESVDNPIALLDVLSAELTSSFSPELPQTLAFTTAAREDNVGLLNFYSSHSLQNENNNINHVVINIHGLSAEDGDVRNEYRRLTEVINSTSLATSTLVLSPHFDHNGIGAKMDWEDAVWRTGGRASSPTGVTLSSFQILDFLLSEFFLSNDNFPNLLNILVTGHSAGGQFVQRYAAISRLESSDPSYHFYYAAANASHYLYLNDQRWDGARLYTPLECEAYNHYPYGLDSLKLDDRYAFISQIGIETIRSNYLERKVFYLLGAEDTTGATSDCESQSQQGGSGERRLERGRYLHAYLNALYPSHSHELRLVSGAGHRAEDIYQSPEYLQLLLEVLD